MYRRILVAVENSAADHTILSHVRELATLTGAELLLVHVADGWAARNYDGLKITETHLKNLAAWKPGGKRTEEVPFVVRRRSHLAFAPLAVPRSCHFCPRRSCLGRSRLAWARSRSRYRAALDKG